MVKSRLPAIITPDGWIDPATLGGISIHPSYGAPTLSAHLIVQLRNDFEVAIAEEQKKQLNLIGKSGHSRVMMTVEQCEEADVDQKHRVTVPIAISSLRAVQIRRNGVRDELLSVLSDMVREQRRSVNIGRIALVSPEHALPKGEIIDAIKSHRLRLSPNVDPEQAISDDGTIHLSLEDVHALFCEENFDEEAMRRVIRFGKHGLAGIQALTDGLPEAMDGRQSLVSAIRLSLGPYVAVIDRQTNKEDVIHLAARVMDGIRTTGIDVLRQVELFNLQLGKVTTKDLTIGIKLYHATKETQDFGDAVINRRTIERGVSFAEVIELEKHPERIFRLMSEIGPTKADHRPYGYLVGAQKSKELSWTAHPSFQLANLAAVNAKFHSTDPKYFTHGQDVPYFVRPLSSVLRYIGGEQNEGGVSATWGFPPPDVMRKMMDGGTAVFIAHDLRMRSDAFNRENPLLNEAGRTSVCDDSPGGNVFRETTPTNDVYFDGELYAAFQHLYSEGARFLIVRHARNDSFNHGSVMQAEVLEWDRRGFWLRPSEKERLDRVDTIISMYGSHVDGMESLLHDQLTRFSSRMKARFGESLAFIHGKGPGIMYIADDVASQLNIFTIGVGINAERFGQSPNFHPDAQVDFQTPARLIRQKHMNDRATMNVFNIGALGTLEEVAISLCSQKLLKNIPAPMIFVDPKGMGRDGKHLWQKLLELIQELASSKKISSDDAAEGVANIQLLQSYMANFVHLVGSYDEAADLIEMFADDPVGYYINVANMPRDSVVQAFGEAVSTYRETSFPMPSWLSLERIASDPRWREAA